LFSVLISDDPMQMEMELITLKGRYHLGMSHTSTGIIVSLLDSMDFMEIFAEQGRRYLFLARGFKN
jgi:hypothetical protein